MSRTSPIAALVTAILLAAPSHAQTPRDTVDHDANAWLVTVGQHRWSQRWGLYIETQTRRSGGIDRPKQYFLRPGLQYHWTDKLVVTAGYAFVRTSPYGVFGEEIATPEHRAWEQVEVEGSAGRVTLEQRVRVEQRFEAEIPEDADPPRRTGWTYGNRARYQLRATLPLHGGESDGPGAYLTATEEPFVVFGHNDRGRAFDQNRLFGGLGYRFGERLRAELGYLNQYDVQPSGRGREISHVVQLYLASDAPFGARGAKRK